MTSDRHLNLMALMRDIDEPSKTYRRSVRLAASTETGNPINVDAVKRGEAALDDIERTVRDWTAKHPEPSAALPDTALTPEREQEIRESIPTVYSPPWTVHPDMDDDVWRVMYATDNPLAGLVAEVPDYGAHLAEFIATARAAVPELLAEVDRLRARLWELERPSTEAERNALRQSFTELIAQAEQDRDHEGAFGLECQLREREEQWKTEDAAAVPAPVETGE